LVSHFFFFFSSNLDPSFCHLLVLSEIPTPPGLVCVGPGCSSLGVGAFSENGPFRPSGQVLVKNEYSWNKGNVRACRLPTTCC
jgi:hypothetical protein